ncbi:hypothetical protein STEG23_022369 [Scotinomys teguina]
MAAAAAGVGRLEEEALRRKERLKALREKTGRKDREDGEPQTKQLREEEEDGKHSGSHEYYHMSSLSGLGMGSSEEGLRLFCSSQRKAGSFDSGFRAQGLTREASLES